MKKISMICIAIIILSSCMMSSIASEDINIHNKDARKFAVIVVGRFAGRWQDMFPQNFQQYYTWYLKAAAMTYSMLKDYYNYTDNEIFLLVSLRGNYEVPSSFNPSWIDGESTKENIEEVIVQFKPGGKIWLDADDSLFFTFIDHGLDENSETNGKFAHDTFISLPYEYKSIKELIQYYIFKKDQQKYKIYDWELGQYFDNVHADRMILLFQPCYSGGFINDLSGINRIICTASMENQVATVSWIEPFIKGLMGNADANGDQKISILEAYEYAARSVNEHTSDEHPLLDDNDDGIGHHYSSVGYDPTDPNADGYLSGRTYL